MFRLFKSDQWEKQGWNNWSKGNSSYVSVSVLVIELDSFLQVLNDVLLVGWNWNDFSLFLILGDSFKVNSWSFSFVWNSEQSAQPGQINELVKFSVSPVVKTIENFLFFSSSDVCINGCDGGHLIQMSWISEKFIVVLLFNGFNSVGWSVFVLSNNISSGNGLDQMLAVLGDPTQVKNEFSFDFSLDWQSLISLNGEWSEDDVTFFITSVSLD